MQVEIEFNTSSEEMEVYSEYEGKSSWFTHNEHLQVFIGKRIVTAKFSGMGNRIIMTLEDQPVLTEV